MTLSENQCQFTSRLADLVKVITTSGFNVKLLSVLRSPSWQQELLKAGKTRTLNSLHLKGLAADIALFHNGVYLSQKKDYQQFGDWWKSEGDIWVWGGDWTFADAGHFELNPDKAVGR